MIDLTRYEFCRLVEKLILVDEVNYEARDHNRAVRTLQEQARGPVMEPEEKEPQPVEKECPLKPESGRPTERDGDKDGLVQYLCNGVWGYSHWSSVAAQTWEWCHTPRWFTRSNLLKELNGSPRICTNGKITYHIPKELVDNLKEFLSQEE